MSARIALPPETHFRDPSGSHVGLDPMTLQELRLRDARQGLIGRIERAQFLMLLRISRGHGEHLLDFETRILAPGTLLIVQPGQVQQWRLNDTLEGDLLLVDPVILQPSPERAHDPDGLRLHIDRWPTTLHLAGAETRDWGAFLALLKRRIGTTTPDALDTVLARQLFRCLVLWLSQMAQRERGARPPQHTVYARFMQRLETHLFARPKVDALAHELGVSAGTLSRICLRCTGYSAKHVIDQRLGLEAKRMLVHSDMSSADIAEALGFSEPTNFLKFFKREAGETPEQFRQRYCGNGFSREMARHTGPDPLPLALATRNKCYDGRPA